MFSEDVPIIIINFELLSNYVIIINLLLISIGKAINPEHIYLWFNIDH